jgi:hypothetical protein
MHLVAVEALRTVPLHAYAPVRLERDHADVEHDAMPSRESGAQHDVRTPRQQHRRPHGGATAPGLDVANDASVAMKPPVDARTRFIASKSTGDSATTAELDPAT